MGMDSPNSSMRSICGGAAAGMRARRATSSAGGGGFSGGGGSNTLRLRRSPTMVLVIMSLCFIGFVTALYIFGFGKLYRSRTAAASA